MKTIIIIGGGLSGLTAAYLLSKKGFRVIIIEKKKHLGGRAYSFKDKITNLYFDNGQHILMGCYKYTLKLLEEIGSHKYLKIQNNLCLKYFDINGHNFTLNTRNLPAPFNILFALTEIPSVTKKDILHILKFGINIYKSKIFNSYPDISTKELLIKNNQRKVLQEILWDPIILSALNTKPDIASSKIFINTIFEIFFKSKNYSRIILPERNLNEIFSEPLKENIESYGCNIILGKEVVKFNLDKNEIKSIILKDGSIIIGDIFISSIPYFDIIKFHELNKIVPIKNFERMKSSPIICINIFLNKNIITDEIIICLKSKSQVIFNKSKFYNLNDNSQIISIVISASSELIDMQLSDLLSIIKQELVLIIPGFDLKYIKSIKVIKERKATLLIDNETEQLRPQINTEYKNFFLIGDWISTGLPATIESAVRSAYLVNNLIS